MLSDWNHEVIRKYGVVAEDVYGMIEIAERSIFVLDAEGSVIHKWVREGENPDFGDLIDEIRTVIRDEETR